MTYTKYDQSSYPNVDTYIQDNLSSVCKLWLSSRNLTLNDGEGFSQWNSFIGNSYATVLSGYSQVYTRLSLNGYKTARFDTNSVMVVDPITITNMNEFHLFYLYNPGDYPVLNNFGPTIHMSTSFKKNFIPDTGSISSPNSFASGFGFQITPGNDAFNRVYGYSQGGSYTFSGLRTGNESDAPGNNPGGGMIGDIVFTYGFKNQWQLIEIASGDAI